MQREETVSDAEPGKPRSTRAPELNPFEAVNFFFDRAADHVGLADEMRAIFRSSYRELTVQVPVRMDDGHLEVYTGYRVQHNAARGPYKGGVRYHPVGGRKRRREGRPEDKERGGKATPPPPLHADDQLHPRHQQGHPGA